MIARLSPNIQKKIEAIYKHDKKLAKRIEKQITLFQENPLHPSLRTHKLSGTMNNLWSISISRSIRMVYIQRDKNTALFVKVGTHEEVYEK